jgi:hypothetical protein
MWRVTDIRQHNSYDIFHAKIHCHRRSFARIIGPDFNGEKPATSRADLTFATCLPRFPHANVKSKAPLASIIR